MRLAVDCSNYTGPIEAPALEAIKFFRSGRTRIRHAICGTQVPSVCNQQLRTFWDAGLSVDAYVQPSLTSDLKGLALKAQWGCEDFPSFFVPSGNSRIWFAFEQNPGENISWIEEGLRQLRQVGFLRLGIYTRHFTWENLVGREGDYLARKYPLWYADYLDQYRWPMPVTAHEWRAYGFGGWWKPSWKQYWPNHDFGGQNFDLNVSP